MGNKDESVARIIASSPGNSQVLPLLPPFPFFLSLTPHSKCNLASLKVQTVPPSKQFYYRHSKEKKYAWIYVFLNCTGQFDISLGGKSCTEGENWSFISSVGPRHAIAANKLKASHPKFIVFFWQNTFYWWLSTSFVKPPFGKYTAKLSKPFGEHEY